MAAASPKLLFNETGVSSSVNSDPIAMEEPFIDFVGELTITNAAALDTDVLIEHSPHGS